MIEYKLDQQPNSNATAHLKNMAAVLEEISTTYQILLELLEHQKSALSSPSINNFRDELRKDVMEAEKLAVLIADNSSKLVVISEQAGRHLAAIEDKFDAVLKTQRIRAKVNKL